MPGAAEAATTQPTARPNLRRDVPTSQRVNVVRPARHSNGVATGSRPGVRSRAALPLDQISLRNSRSRRLSLETFFLRWLQLTRSTASKICRDRECPDDKGDEAFHKPKANQTCRCVSPTTIGPVLGRRVRQTVSRSRFRPIDRPPSGRY